MLKNKKLIKNNKTYLNGKYFLTLLGYILFILHLNTQVTQTKGLSPQSIIPYHLKIQLAKKYPGFHIPESKEFAPIVIETLGYKSMSLHPAVIQGDWNNDNQTDLALLLINKDKQEEDLIVLACHNQNKKSYKVIELDHIIRPKILGADKLLDFLRLTGPGKKEVYDPAKKDVITVNLQQSSIERGILEKNSVFYYWTGKRYKQYFTSLPEQAGKTGDLQPAFGRIFEIFSLQVMNNPE